MTNLGPAVPGKTLHADTLMDGTSTLAEIVDRLDAAADWLRALDHDGWTLEEAEVTDGYTTLVDPNGDILCCGCGENLIPARGRGECAECSPED